MLAVVGSIAAIAVVTARNVVHAALYLVVTLGCVGAVYLLLGAEFVGWVQILIYVGAIVILFLFGLMLTKAPDRTRRPRQPAAVARDPRGGARLRRRSVFLIQDAFPVKDASDRELPASTGVVGESLFRHYVLPFEAVSFLLLAALIGAIVLARKDDA